MKKLLRKLLTQLFLIACCAFVHQSHGGNADVVFLEAEQFSDCGGWDLDQQSMEQMGSPYLLAHGLGIPVKDAVTKAKFPSPGTYHVWARTRDWVAPWKAPGTPGKFQLFVNDQPIATTFGTEGAEWHWQDGGTVEVGVEGTLSIPAPSKSNI